jgi:hypothetical protein
MHVHFKDNYTVKAKPTVCRSDHHPFKLPPILLLLFALFSTENPLVCPQPAEKQGNSSQIINIIDEKRKSLSYFHIIAQNRKSSSDLHIID